MTRRQATLTLVVITLLWGMNITAVKVLFEHASPMVSLAIRYLIAGLILAPSLRGLQRREVRAGAGGVEVGVQIHGNPFGAAAEKGGEGVRHLGDAGHPEVALEILLARMLGAEFDLEAGQ